ncbi:MAG: NAD(P)H-hydrate dehydratase [Sphingomicrobium sp.]
MTPNRPILTAAALREAEARAIAAGKSVETLMERAGAVLAECIFRFVGVLPVLILAGPGNNGGDGYVAARHLAARGIEVRVAALADPASDAAIWARSQWHGPVETLTAKTPAAPVLVDALFGTGLTRGLSEELALTLARLGASAQVRIACDVPSGVDSDSGVILSAIPDYDLTVAFGALKPAHRLMPAMVHCGRVALADIGIAAQSDWNEIGAPELPSLDPAGHKYTRGLVHLLAGTMPGAIVLAANAAARSGAGFVRVSTSKSLEGLLGAVFETGDAQLNDERIGCILVGPGMGDLPQVLTLALTSKAPKVLDADALRHVGEPGRLKGQDCIVTPHTGEFEALFGKLDGSKAEQAVAAARQASAVVVFKGPDTIVAAPDGRIGFAPPAPAWLASAGTGDVLAGMIAALRACGMEPFAAACGGVWLHGRAAEFAGPTMTADDLVHAIPRALRGG